MSSIDACNDTEKELSYEFTHEGKVPTMQICTYTQSIENVRQTYSYSHYYEYK